jgi:DNA-binding MarR family transcriptional regulator
MTSGGYRIGMMSRLQGALLERRLRSYGVAAGQLPYLMEALCKPGQTQDEMAARVGVSRAATARALRTLEQDGLVTRAENPDNRRQKLVSPTERARALEVPLRAVLDGHNQMLFKDFSPQERTLALGLMDRIVQNLKTSLDNWDNS